MSALSSLSELPDNFVIRPETASCIRVVGDDTDSYLHGQLTVNINQLDGNTARFSAHCDNKGKAWAVLTVIRHGNAVLLTGNQDAVEASFAQLQKYGVFSNVEMTRGTDEYSQVIVSQQLGLAACQALFGDTPTAPMTTVSSDLGVVIQTRLEKAPLHFVLTQDGEEKLTQWLSACERAFTEFDEDAVYEALCISSGIPAVAGEMIGQYIPQMLNVQAINGIDYDKGCYMGQEVVARTHFLGRNKRAAYIFTVPAPVEITAGDTVEKQLGENWRRGGNVVRCATLANESWFMAVLANDTGYDDAHRLAAQPEYEITPHALPYSIAQENRKKPGT